MNIQAIQTYLREHQLDGWLMADFHARNTVAVDMLGLPAHLTRRFFYYIPANGEPIGLVHNIEKAKFGHVPGKLTPFSSYKMLEEGIAGMLTGARKIAMEYSPMGRLPYVGLVDAGTIEFVRSLGLEIVSSADLVANFQARLTVEQMASHRIAARNLIEIKDKAFGLIRESLSAGKKITEWDVCAFMLDLFEKFDMETDAGPNCSVGANAGNPHYEPTPEQSETIKRDQLVLLDIWAKLKTEKAVYADITWMGFAGAKASIPADYVTRFAVIRDARDRAVAFLRENYGKRPMYGFDVDDATRAVITDAGLGQYFTHRTGHSIHVATHGPGPNIDNLETEDRRLLQPGHLFSVEPGVYFSDCGFRTEIDVLIGHDGIEVTTLPLQTEITALF